MRVIARVVAHREEGVTRLRLVVAVKHHARRLWCYGRKCGRKRFEMGGVCVSAVSEEREVRWRLYKMRCNPSIL